VKKTIIFLSFITLSGCATTTKKDNPYFSQQKRVEKIETEKKETVPEDFIQYYFSYSIAKRKGEIKRAKEYLEKAIKLAPENSQLLLEASMFYATENNLKKATEFAKKAISKAKNTQEREKALRLLGTIYIMEEEKEKAMKIYEDLTSFSEKPQDYVIYGKLLLQKNKTKKAEKVLRKGIKLDKNNSTLNLLLGYTLFKREKLKESWKILLKAAELDPENEETYKLLSEIYKKTKSEQIKTALEKLAKKENPPLPLLKELVKLYIINGEKENAVKTLSRIVKREPYNLKTLSEVANNLLGLKEYSKVIPVIERITKLNPNNPNAYLILGISYELAGYKNKAIEAYEKALDLFPENTTVIEQLANLYFEVKKYEEAKAYYERLLQLTKKPDYLLKIAKIEEKTGNTRKAYNLLKKEVETGNNKPAILFYLSVLSDKLGKEYETVTYLKQVLKKHPDNPVALNYLAYIYANNGENLNEALELVKKALKLQPENPAYLDTYGWILFKLKQYKKACTILKKAYKLSNHDPVIEEHLGECYYYTGKWQMAKELLQKAVNRMIANPDSIDGEKNILKRAKEILERLK